MKVQGAEICLAKTRSVRKHRVKYRGELARRTRYDTQHLRGRRLLFKGLGKVPPRLGELAGAHFELLFQLDQ
jgi:hypothetical protein